MAPAASAVGVPQLRALWEHARRARGSDEQQPDAVTWLKYVTVLRGLEVGLHETFAYLYQEAPGFETFERWIVAKNGGAIGAERIARINAAVAGERVDDGADVTVADALSAADLAFWVEHGYVVLRDAVPPEQCAAATGAICEFLGADLRDPQTWYAPRKGRSIWVPLLHHPALWANRRAPRIRTAFAQIWGRRDLWTSVDQAGFNPPERDDWQFPGPHLHWDTELVPPVRFDVHGILYLTDTPAHQGAFTCVPGFHRRVDDWLRALPAGADPQKQNLTALGPVAVGGRAGDFVIWRSALPHGASPNRGDAPRIVQYIQMQPGPDPAVP